MASGVCMYLDAEEQRGSSRSSCTLARDDESVDAAAVAAVAVSSSRRGPESPGTKGTSPRCCRYPIATENKLNG